MPFLAQLILYFQDTLISGLSLWVYFYTWAIRIYGCKIYRNTLEQTTRKTIKITYSSRSQKILVATKSIIIWKRTRPSIHLQSLEEKSQRAKRHLKVVQLFTQVRFQTRFSHKIEWVLLNQTHQRYIISRLKYWVDS